MPRQNGKGEILIARELFGLFELGERLVIHTAHEFKTSAEHFQRFEAVIRGVPGVAFAGCIGRRRAGWTGSGHAHGDESITLDDGERMQFKTRTKKRDARFRRRGSAWCWMRR